MEKKIIIGLGTAATGLLAGLTGHVMWKEHKLQKKMGEAIEKVKSMTVSELSESLIREAITKAANETTEKYIRQDNDSVMRDTRSKLEKEVHDMVRGEYDKVRNEVGSRVAEEVAKLESPEAMRKTVCSRAEDILVHEFRGDLSELKDKAEEAIREIEDDYKDKLHDKMDDFESDMDKKLESFGDNLRSMKRIYDAVTEGYKSRDREDGIRLKVF